MVQSLSPFRFNRAEWLDAFLIGVELASRHVYWRVPYLRTLYQKWSIRQKGEFTVSREPLRDHLQRIGVGCGALVMVHSSIQNITVISGRQDEPASANPFVLLRDLLELIGDAGTLAMPTHPYYRDEPGFMYDKSNLIFRYNPRKIPSRAGLLTEMFRRLPNVERSLHPLSSLACRGPLARALLHDNLNRNKPLPHGVYSGYYRFCQLGGLVVSIGVPLIKSMSVMHVAEELKEAEWSVKDFFYERRFIVSIDSEDHECVVRERRPEFVRSLALYQLRRDLLREGVLHEGEVCGVRCDWAHAQAVLSFMIQKNKNSTYPYWWPRLAKFR